MEGINKIPEPQIISIDLSESWDTQSQVEIFFNEIKKLPFYRPDLLYSGFSGEHVGRHSSEMEEGLIFASKETSFYGNTMDNNNPLEYALRYEEPVVAIYDPKYLKSGEKTTKGVVVPVPEAYEVKDPRAIIAFVKLVGI